ncbi:MAG TPA: HIT domain-containing protein [Bacteroidota bacterium]|nr:HIT domain-containing protein [Bacteroidota bacterium]
MDRLFSPWRSRYIASFIHATNDEACVFCTAHAERRDDEHFVVYRGETCFIVMNLYPYNSGHVMIVPNRHIGTFTDLTPEESSEVMRLTARTITALQSVIRPDGFNFGSNLGKTAGAGIDKHIHFHLVPRWNGDTNFMPVLADTKMISEDMADQLKRLRSALTAVK